jgi:hypothetical protein
VDDNTYTTIIQQFLVSAQAVPNYTLHSGILRYKGKICIGNSTELKQKILSSLHSSTLGGHSGIRATLHRIKRIFHWPNMKKTVELFVAECPVCQRSKSEHCHSLLNPLRIPAMAWSFISMDFIEGHPKSAEKNVILVVVDRLTKYAHFIALAHPFTAQIVAQVLIDQVIKLHGTPIAIVADRDRIFTSKM